MAALASAGTFGEPKIGQRYTNGATSLKITEPEGFKITVATEAGDKVGTAPEVFALPEKDAFVTVTLLAPDGTKWSKKVEIVAKKQTELAISFKADAPAPAAEPAKGRSYIGKMLNSGGGCGKAYKGTIRADFLEPTTGTVKASSQIAAGANRDVEVPSGALEIRVFLSKGNEWQFVTTGNYEFKKDGWQLGFGCKQGSTKPVVVGT